MSEHDVPDPTDLPTDPPTDPVRETPSEDDADPDREALLARLMRLQAEYENFRKRVAREKTLWTAEALERFVLDLLPVVDSFDRALGAGASAGDGSSEGAGIGDIFDGMRLVKRLLVGALRAHGVEPIDALGEEFDPNVHEAFLSRPAGPGEAPGTIVEELVTGYRMGERTVRPTRGIVASEAEQDGGSRESPEEE